MARKSKQKGIAQDTQDVLIRRIDECQEVLTHMDSCPAWAVILKDLNLHKQFIDDNWQNIPESDNKLKELRITKLAYMHLLNLKSQYQQDLDSAKEELSKLENPDTQIARDYDNG